MGPLRMALGPRLSLYISTTGSDDMRLLDKDLNILNHLHCIADFYLERGRTYLVMGSSKDIRRDNHSQM